MLASQGFRPQSCDVDPSHQVVALTRDQPAERDPGADHVLGLKWFCALEAHEDHDVHGDGDGKNHHGDDMLMVMLMLMVLALMMVMVKAM